MAAVFNYAVVYRVSAVCRTPLRTAGADGDTETVLRYSCGGAFIQGASIAGAFRGWVEKNYPKTVEALFGSQNTGGHLTVSDAKFDNAAEQTIRPRLKICGKTGSAIEGGKFDVAHICTGATLSFELCWMGDKREIGETQIIEKMLSALNTGQIRFGAQKTNGFGRVTINVRRQFYDMTTDRDLSAWLSDTYEGKPVELPDLCPFKSGNTVTFIVNGQADSILVKSGASLERETGSVTENITEGGYAIIPGSSIKGAVRARVESIAELIGISNEIVENFFGRCSKGSGSDDNGVAGLIYFEDVRLEDKTRKVSRIHINRFTGGVIRGGLFSENLHEGSIRIRIIAPSDEPVACGLLIYALRDLGLGLYNLGSGGALGRGYLKVNEITVTATGKSNATIRFKDNFECETDDANGLILGWLKAVNDCRNKTRGGFEP